MASLQVSDQQHRRTLRVVLGVVLLIILVLLTVLRSCGLQSSPPLTGYCIGYTSAQSRTFLRDRLMVIIRMPAGLPTLSSEDQSAIQQTLQQVLQTKKIGSNATVQLAIGTNMPSTLIEGDMTTGKTATLFYQLTNNRSSTGCDFTLTNLVDAVDTQLGQTTLSVPTPHDGTLKILAASPDWTTNGSGGENDNSRGQPGGPAQVPATTPLQASDFALSASDINSSCDAACQGGGTAVIVLDTAYPTSGRIAQPKTIQHHPMTCTAMDITGLSCLPKAQPLENSSPDILAAYTASKSEPGPLTEMVDSHLVESIDMALPTDTADPATHLPGPIAGNFASATSKKPILDIDHGLFVSSLIHEAAPQATVRLVRVLNDYNVGDMQTILLVLNALYHSMQMHSTPGYTDAFDLPNNITQVIVNFSLKVGPNPDCENAMWQQELLGRSASCTLDATQSPPKADVETSLHRFEPLAVSLDSLEKDWTILMVGAAGNEKSSLPNIPALFCGVASVASVDIPTSQGAFMNSNSLSQFSNRPVQQGGTPGEIMSDTCYQSNINSNEAALPSSAAGIGNAEAANGVIGVYLQPINGSNPQANHYLAVWAGTSFAAPIYAGYLAAPNYLAVSAPPFLNYRPFYQSWHSATNTYPLDTPFTSYPYSS